MPIDQSPSSGSGQGASDRLDVLDALRGFALCGILLVNLPHMGWLIDSRTPVPGTHPGSAAAILWWVQTLVVDGTMRGLFSLLFGAGMILFLAKVERGTATAAEGGRLMSRRLLWLFLFGVLNATLLLWPGDILIIYAIAGFLVLPFWRSQPRSLATGAAITVAALSLWMAADQLPKRAWVEQAAALERMVRENTGLSPAQRQLLEERERWEQARVASPAEIQQERSIRLGTYPVNVAFLSGVSWKWFWDIPATARWVVDAAAFMLLGMLLLRLGVLQGKARACTYWLLVVIGYGVGLPLKTIDAAAQWSFYVTLGEPQFWQFLLPALTRQPARLLVTLGHLGLLLLVWRAASPLRPLQALGRMAFTGYLLQSVLAALAFSGFGLALWGSLSLPELWFAAAAIWGIEITLAVVWLKRFSMGPLEWLWRALTYGRYFGPILRR